ncbi:hypothetical protein PHLCEN_2v55 [Hermanssonia centrifuga]|uniref:Uncharacterized protein n=1 Tax=Hermanssonia centrifuga TaxID=98765 RepID=A0A2R6S737_9APHY|nr:hypothetical protein PHLCEN_2v55 [Hermanssonia centrifuga]
MGERAKLPDASHTLKGIPPTRDNMVVGNLLRFSNPAIRLLRGQGRQQDTAASRFCAGIQTPTPSSGFPPPSPLLPVYPKVMFTSSLTPPPSRTITGANVPEDLFERILDFLDEEIARWRHDEGKEKHKLGECSLTCRYWARRCQARTFEHIRLQSEKDMDQLLSFLESTSSRLSGYIKHLYLFHDKWDPKSWIYLVPLQLVPKLSLIPTIRMEFYGPWGENTCVLSTICFTAPVPTSHPTSQISNCGTFNFVVSKTWAAHLVGELRSLQTLECQAVEWSSPVPENYVVPVCLPSLATGVLFLLGRRRMLRNEATPFFRLDPNQQLLATSLIYDFLRMFTYGYPISNYEIEKVDGVYHMYCECVHAHTNILFKPTTDSQKCEVHLETIAIDLTDFWQTGTAMKGGWKSDTLVSPLPGLQKVIFGFLSRKELLRFVNEVVDTQMENLRDTGKLRYAVFDIDETKQWMRASPGSDKLECYNGHLTPMNRATLASPSEIEDHGVVDTETENLREAGEPEHAMSKTSNDSDDVPTPFSARVAVESRLRLHKAPVSQPECIGFDVMGPSCSAAIGPQIIHQPNNQAGFPGRMGGVSY